MEARTERVNASQFFLIPTKHADEDNLAYEKRIIANVFERINQLLNQYHDENKEASFKSQVAEDLLAITRKLDHHISLHILFEASRHPLFLNDAAHGIIIKGIQKENYHRSPINKNEKTLAFLRKHQTIFPDETDSFLKNPERLIIWLNEASPLEISRVFDDFYPAGTEYYAHMRELAETEYMQNDPYKAFICFSVMAASPLSELGRETLQQAYAALLQREPDKFKSIARSIEFRIHYNAEYMRLGNGHYINGIGIALPNQKMDFLKIDGARLKRALLDDASMNACSLIGGSLEQASLKKASLVDTNLQQVFAQHADFSGAELMYADLRGADLSRANLSHANLSGAKWDYAIFVDTDLSDTIFFNKASFKFTESLEAELGRLDKMLRQVKPADKLQRAILTDFLKHAANDEIPTSYRITSLKLAYDHSLFNQHTDHGYLKYLTNKGSRFFYRNHQDSYETKEQIALRQMIEKLDAITAPIKTI